MLFFLIFPLFVLNLSFCMPYLIDITKTHRFSEVSIRFDKSIHKGRPYSVVPAQKHARGLMTNNNHCLGSSMLRPCSGDEDHSQTGPRNPKERKRMFRFSLENQLQLRRMDLLAEIVPISVTAAILEHFYSQILQQIQNDWSLSPPEKSLVLTYGSFELSLAMRGGEIPWRMVADLVESMLLFTRAQLTHTYHAYWETPDQTVSLSVLLRILPDRRLGGS